MRSLFDLQTVKSPAVSDSRTRRFQIEMGWMVAGKLDEPDRVAVAQARAASQQWLQQAYPEFDWKMPLVEREELVRSQRVEPVELLDQGVTERNVRRWDFTLIVTSADLLSHYKQDAFSVLSRSLQSAVISTVRIDPRAYRKEIATEERVRIMAVRVQALAMHAVGHLGGLQHEKNTASFMADFQTVSDLDHANQLSEEQQSQLLLGLRDVADRRLEEQTDVRRVWKAWFYLRASWINRRQLTKAVWQARPWQFPFRLSRLTTAATAAMLILMTTAEAWELGLHQSALLLATLSGVTVVSTTLYVLMQQRLFVRRDYTRLSELSVVTNVSTFVVVFTGMATTFLMLCGLLVIFASLFYGPEIINRWVPLGDQRSSAEAYVKLATFVASLGMFIGALGASFEQQHYFRHITFVDEEI